MIYPSLLLTLGVWLWVFIAPRPRASGAYDIGPSLIVLTRLVVATFVSLLTWLVFFILLSIRHP